MDQDIPENIFFFIKCISNTHHIDFSYLKRLYTNCSENRLTLEDLSQKSLDEINKMCELRGIPKIGTKSILIEKIITNTNPETTLFTLNMSSLKNMCKEKKLKMTGNKTELVLRLYYNENISESTTTTTPQTAADFIQGICNVHDVHFLNTLDKKKLVEMCKDKNLNHIGSKKTLIDRLTQVS